MKIFLDVDPPAKSTIFQMVKKFRETGSYADQLRAWLPIVITADNNHYKPAPPCLSVPINAP